MTAAKKTTKKAPAKAAAQKASPKPRAPRRSAAAKTKSVESADQGAPKVQIAEGVAVEPHQSVRGVGALHSPSGAALNPLFHD